MKTSVSKTVSFCFLISILLICESCHKNRNEPTVQPPVKVTVIEVVENNKGVGMEFSGTVSSAESTTVSFAVAGTIMELFAREGDKVSKGQLLGKVRNGEYQNAYNIAQAQLDGAQDGYNRLKKLHDAKALPDIKWVEIQQKLKQAQNAVEMAERTLNDANLHSPASGTISKKLADVGQTVVPVEPIYEIVSTSDLTIDIPVSESEIGVFSIGMPAKVAFPSLGKDTLMGKINSKNVVADPLTRSFTMKVSIPNPDGKILPGMVGNVRFENDNDDNALGEAFNGITLPSQAVLLNDDNRLFVWVVVDSLAQRRFVTADELTDGGVLIKTGLQPGDKVVIEGIQKIGSGSKVIY